MSIRHAWIKQFLLKPLSLLHGELKATAEVLYLDALTGYSDDELKAVFVHLRDNYAYQRFPSIADIQAARKAVNAGAGRASSPAQQVEHPWEERNRKRKAAAAEYVTSFMKSGLGQEAEREGWDCQLRRYVHARAWVQAQFLHGGQTDYIASDPILQIDPKFSRRFLEEEKQQAATGHIGVSVPATFIAEWKREAEFYRSRTQEKASGVAKSLGQALEGMVP